MQMKINRKISREVNEEVNEEVLQKSKKNTDLELYQYEFFQLRALCDEIMRSLCQAKALLEPVSEDTFFQRLDIEVLRHYFYALDTIIDAALDSKDKISHVVDAWEKQLKPEPSSKT